MTFTEHQLTFAISAQLFPASLIVFNLCSSAGVQGVFVRLFLAGGGAIGEEVMLGSSAPIDAGAPPEGPDMARFEASLPDARLLFREPEGDNGSGFAVGSPFTVESTLDGCAREGDIPVGSKSCLSPRLDIWRRQEQNCARV